MRTTNWLLAQDQPCLSRRGRARLRAWLAGMHGITVPTSVVNRLTGTEAWTDPVSLPAGTTIGGAFIGANAPVNATGSTLTLTQALHGGKIVTINRATGITITPPPATGTGTSYRLFVGTTMSGGSTTIDAKAGNASDVFYGLNLQMLVGTGSSCYATASNSNLITLNGSTQGGLKGDWITLADVATNVWFIEMLTVATGSVATPFSNH
jgi:hypothetical protein